MVGLLRRAPPDRELVRAGVQVALAHRRVLPRQRPDQLPTEIATLLAAEALRQPTIDAREQPLRLIAREAVLGADRAPNLVHVGLPLTRSLRSPRTRGQRLQLSGFGVAAVTVTKLRRRALDLHRPRRPLLGQFLRDAPDLEVASAPTGLTPDLQPLAFQVVRELRAIPRTVSPRRPKQRPGIHRREPPVPTFGAQHHDMGVQLRVGHPAFLLIARQPTRGVHELAASTLLARS